ncbi:MAG: type I secretion system permease/ATPase, partial [Pseudomonadota bacterium]
MRGENGIVEMRKALGQCRSHFIAVGVFSVFVNILMLTGPIFMLQTYDRVLTSRSEETLVALVLLVSFLFGMMGILDYTRGRMLARAGARFSELLESRVFTAVMRTAVAPGMRARPNVASRNLDAIRNLLSSPAPFAVF